MKPLRSMNLVIVLTLLTSWLAAVPPTPTQAAPTAYDCTTATGLPQSECEALVALYNATDGDNWDDKTDWLQTTTPCDWYGVTCADGNVTELDMTWNQMSGSIPPEIGNLTALTYLNLGGNDLTSMPPEISNLAALTKLNLWSNALTSLPPEISNLTNLTELNLSYNDLNSVPPELWNLTNLIGLYLGENALTSLPPEIGNLTNLAYLGWSGSDLTSLPPELWTLTNLLRLHLSHNALTSLPPDIGKLTNLQMVYLSGNALTSVPSEIGNLTNLIGLNLDNNALTSVPSEIGNLTNLMYLYLGGNALTSVPPELWNLTKLYRLRLDNNALTSVPSEIGNLTALTWLRLDDNQLSGPIPAEIGDLTALTDLGLSGNQLSGPIPAEIGNLTTLTLLRLNNNQLSGALPTALTSLTQLNSFYFHDTDLCVPSTGAVPEWLAGISDVQGTGLTCEESGLRVVITEPADNATGVPTSISEITVEFNKPVYAPSLNDLTMVVWDGESRVNGTIEYRPDSKVAVFKPDELAPGTQYLVMLTSNIVAADDPEQHLETYSWLFTTAGSERDKLIRALRALQTALTDKIAYDAQIVSIDFTLARELHKQKALLDFLNLSSEVFLLWTGKDADALFGDISEFTDIVGKVSLAIETAGLIEDAQAMEARLRDIVKIADQDYGGRPLVGEEFDTSGYQNYFRDAIMGSQSPVKFIPLLWGPVGYTPSEVDATNRGPSGVQSEVTLQFDTLIEELPDPLPLGLEVDELIADIKRVTGSIRRSQHREEEIRYSAYFPGYWEPFPQNFWLGAVAEDSKMTSRLASDAANKVKEEAQFTAIKTAMAGTKLVLLVTSGGGAAAAEAIYQAIDVATLPSTIGSVSNSFEADPHTLLDQHVYRMVFDYGLETAMVWRIANEVASSVDHQVHYAYAQTTRSASIEPAVVIGDLKLQDIELTDSNIGEGTGVITISNRSSASIRTRLTGYIDTAVTGSTETSIIGVFSSEAPYDIAPGATKALTFTYTAFSNSHFGVQGYGAKALLHLINLDTLKQSTQGPIEGRFFAGTSRELDVMNNQNVHVAMTGTLSLGQVQTQTVTLGSVQTQTVILQPATQKVRFQLAQDFQSDFDLHLYDELGRHVGFDYTNANIEVNIPNSTYSGREARTEWIEIDPITSSRQFVIKVVAMDSDNAANFSVVAIETPEIPAVVKIFPENLMRETNAPTSTVRLAIREIGGQSEFTQIVLSASDLKSDSGDTIPAANLDFTPLTTTVVAGGELYVTGTLTLPDNLTKTTYTGTLTVEGQDSFTKIPITKTLGITLVVVNPQQIYLPLVLRSS